MITRTIYKSRDRNGEAVVQEYDYSLQVDFLKYKKDNLHKFLRNTFLYGVPKLFQRIDTKSASGCKDLIASDTKGNRIYKERKPAEDTIEYPCDVYGGCTHYFSQIVLESQGFVDKKFRSELGPTNIDAMHQHMDVQRYCMKNRLALAMEVPVWDAEENYTGFIDLLFWYRNSLWIYDYKPECMSAKNKHAVAQLFKLREMLYKRTGIKDINIAYGDEEYTIIPKLNSMSNK